MKPGRPKRTRQRAAARRKPGELSPEARREIEDIVDHKFSDTALLDRAFRHPSVLSGGEDMIFSNQRLEFLGDRVLGLIVAERLFTRRRGEREGELAPRLNRLVSKKACAAAVRHMGLGQFVLMSPHEVRSGGRERNSTLGDLCEAIIAALYLDGGLKPARRFVERAFAPQFETTAQTVKDPKSRLQEWSLERGHGLPDYEEISRQGPDHAPRFRVRVTIDGKHAEGEARGKQDAERAAAAALLERLDDEG